MCVCARDYVHRSHVCVYVYMYAFTMNITLNTVYICASICALRIYSLTKLHEETIISKELFVTFCKRKERRKGKSHTDNYTSKIITV